MPYFCFKCSKQLELDISKKVGRRDDCPSCGQDLHVCLNCKHYDRSVYNECHESQAERVLDKDRSNFCDYFSFNESSSPIQKQDETKAHLKSLDDLFKK